jgi:arylmalonate decarboxylase
MTLSRRTLLGATAATTAFALAGMARGAQARRLGLIFPPAGRGVPEEGIAMYGESIEFLVEGLGLATMTPEGYEAVIDRIGPTAAKLAERGAEAVVLMGTSLSFYKGEAFNQRLTEGMRKATGLPVTTMSTAVIEGLKTVRAQRVVAATAYNDEVNGRLRSFLAEHGFEVLATQGLGVERVEDINSVTQPQLIEFCTEVYRSAAGADSLLVSCGGLRTLEILAPLEQRCSVPAVSSTPHALRAGVRLLGERGTAPGYGTLLAS